MTFRKRKPTWPGQFVQDETSFLRYLDLVAKAWVARDVAGVTPIEHRGERKESPTPYWLTRREAPKRRLAAVNGRRR